MDFYGLETKFDVADNLYLAARYTASENETGDISTDNSLYRWQLAGGYHFTDSALLKVEYANQKEEALSGGQNVDGTGSAEWDGVSVEMSLVF